jgi:hypothetical protein
MSVFDTKKHKLTCYKINYGREKFIKLALAFPGLWKMRWNNHLSIWKEKSAMIALNPDLLDLIMMRLVRMLDDSQIVLKRFGAANKLDRFVNIENNKRNWKTS